MLALGNSQAIAPLSSSQRLGRKEFGEESRGALAVLNTSV